MASMRFSSSASRSSMRRASPLARAASMSACIRGEQCRTLPLADAAAAACSARFLFAVVASANVDGGSPRGLRPCRA